MGLLEINITWTNVTEMNRYAGTSSSWINRKTFGQIFTCDNKFTWPEIA